MDRADAERVLREGRHESGCWVDDTCECVGGDARRAVEAVLRMLPVVTTAIAVREAQSEIEAVRAIDAHNDAVDAYRAALEGPPEPAADHAGPWVCLDHPDKLCHDAACLAAFADADGYYGDELTARMQAAVVMPADPSGLLRDARCGDDPEPTDRRTV